jgi:hypothetical protein
MASMHVLFQEDTSCAVFDEDTIAKNIEEQVNSSSQHVERQLDRAGGQLDVVTCEDADRWGQGEGGALKLPLLEKRSIVTMKYGCNRVIFITIPSNSNYVTLVKSDSKVVVLQ